MSTYVESGGVVWTDVGGSVTIQCRDTADKESLSLEKGLSQEEILNKDRDSEKITIAKGFRDRLQLDGEFPNLNIFIRNLTTDDMGPYWCVYKKYDTTASQLKTEKGKGSVLLVVRGESKEKLHHLSTGQNVLLNATLTIQNVTDVIVLLL